MTNVMKAAVLYGKEDVRLETVPLPQLEAGEVLLRIQAALTCGTDLKVFRNGSHPKMLKPPVLFGHEYAGVVEAIGPGVKRFQPGMRVVGANSAPCGSCFFCQRGKPNLCQDLLFVNGAYAEFLKIPSRIVEKNLLEIPENLSFEAAALTEPLACVLRGFQAIAPAPQETVVVLGAGPVGLLFVQLLIQAGNQVWVVGKGKVRLETARRSGAQTIDLATVSDPLAQIRQQTEKRLGPDLVIEAVGKPNAWEEALQLARPGGRILFFGGCPSGTQVPLDTRRMHYEELTLLSVFHHTPEAIRQSLTLLKTHQVDPTLLITGQASLKELPGLFKQMLTESEGIKTAILPGRTD